MVAGVLPGAYQRKGLLGMGFTYFHVVLTNYRVIFASQTTQMMQQQTVAAKEAARQQGKGFLGQWGAMLTSNLGQHYVQMAPQAILAEQPGNFFIPNNQIRSVKLHLPGGLKIGFGAGDDDANDPVRLEFHAATGKVIVFFNQLDGRESKKLLGRVLGNIVH